MSHTHSIPIEAVRRRIAVGCDRSHDPLRRKLLLGVVCLVVESGTDVRLVEGLEEDF